MEILSLPFLAELFVALKEQTTPALLPAGIFLIIITRRVIRMKLDLVKHLMIKISERSFTQRFDDSMSIFILCSLENDDMESSKRCVKLPSLIFVRLIED